MFSIFFVHIFILVAWSFSNGEYRKDVKTLSQLFLILTWYQTFNRFDLPQLSVIDLILFNFIFIHLFFSFRFYQSCLFLITILHNLPLLITRALLILDQPTIHALFLFLMFSLELAFPPRNGWWLSLYLLKNKFAFVDGTIFHHLSSLHYIQAYIKSTM